MLVLFSTPGGHAIFKVQDKGKLKKADASEIFKQFETPEAASSFVKLKAFSAFKGTKEALAAATALVESEMGKGLEKFLKKQIVKKELKAKLAVADSKLAGIIKDKLGIKCVNDSVTMELMRGIRTQLSTLIEGMDDSRVKQMRLGLSHSLSRYKLKFSPDKVDTMIVQAIGLLDDLDKEINTYAMRVKEWYGWHFPEMQKIVLDNQQYAQTVIKMGMRSTSALGLDLSDILDEGTESQLKEATKVSMGTEITEEDLSNIKELAEQVINLTEYRAQLYAYLQSRMQGIAPNLTVMVGELVGARLISHAGSLMNLAKAPASTVQILGAEKALFRALKTKSDTPKYGLIYHASLIGQAAPKNKGKISRVLAAKTSLAIRVDALGESSEVTIGYTARAKVEARLRQLETGGAYVLAGGAAARQKTEAHDFARADAAPGAVSSTSSKYNDASDSTVATKKSKKRAREEASSDSDESEESAAKKAKAERKKRKREEKEAKKAKKAAKKAKKAKKSE